MKKGILAVIMAAAAMGFVACGGGGGAAATGTIQGMVMDAFGQPVAAATVTVVGTSLSATTDLAGLFQIENVTAADRTTLRASAATYINSNKNVTVIAGQTTFASLTLLAPGASQTLDASAGGTVTDNITGASININPGSLAMVIKSTDANGKTVVTKTPLTGEIDVEVADLPPTSDAFPTFEAESTTDPDEVSMLESFGAMTCAVKQNDVAVSAEFTGTCSVPIPADLVADAPDTIDFWAFNETTGLWEKTGTGTKGDCNGSPCYSGACTHCSNWNADIEIESTCVCVLVVDEEGNPVSGVEVVFAGSTYAGNDRAITDSNGKACGFVKYNATTPEQYYVYATGASGRGPMVGPLDVSATRQTPPDCDDAGTVRYDGEGTIDWTRLSKLTYIYGMWEQEDLNLDLHVTAPAGYHIYFDSVGSLVELPYLMLMNDAGCTPASGTCFPGSDEEVRGYYGLPSGTYNVYIHRRDGSTLPAPAEDEITVFVFILDFEAAQAGGDMTDYFVYQYTSTTTDPAAGQNAWHAFTIVVSETGTITITPVNTYKSVADPADCC
jgi:hypothetical protein